ncbi:hypothetical protein EV360DRAFT_80617 [Lentinula raphanica]|nr:hypothetical protein EV360DRAFT_80617 [Lentinula raphanica]
MTRRNARPILNLRTLYTNTPNEVSSPDSLASSIPATCSPLTPQDGADSLELNSKNSFGNRLEDVFQGETNCFQKVDYHEDDRNYLPPLPEVSDQGSIYSQDSACVVYTTQSRPAVDPTPKSTLTFAAIWDPDHGMSTFSGNQLIGPYGQDHSYADEGMEQDELSWPSYGYDETPFPAFTHDVSGHSDCEPHLPSRFSTTTTSTSNYIEVDFGEEDAKVLSSQPSQDNLGPGDCHPAWIPQIFTVGYTKPPSSGSKRPKISEPFQLASIRSEELSQRSSLPSQFGFTLKSSSLFSRSRLLSSNSVAPSPTAFNFAPAPSPLSGNDSSVTRVPPTSSLRRGFSFGSNHGHHDDHSRTATSTMRNGEEKLSPETCGTLSESNSSRPQTPTRRPSISSVLGKLKTPKKGQSDAWVMVDVEVTPTIHQRLVTMST